MDPWVGWSVAVSIMAPKPASYPRQYQILHASLSADVFKKWKLLSFVTVLCRMSQLCWVSGDGIHKKLSSLSLWSPAQISDVCVGPCLMECKRNVLLWYSKCAVFWIWQIFPTLILVRLYSVSCVDVVVGCCCLFFCLFYFFWRGVSRVFL